MTQHNPKDSLQTELEALGEQFEAEEREDRRADAERRRKGLPEPERMVERLPEAKPGVRSR